MKFYQVDAIQRITPLNDQSMTAVERRAVSALSGLFGLRMLGLFLILPVFVLYARELEGQTPVLVGIALGAYGLTQALFQIPFGMLSDRFGRKPIISIGLLIFAFGSVVAAMADSILWVIIGRALQGSGAITAAILALTADLTRESQRTKAMAIIGGTIGTAFALAFILGPLLDRWIGVPGLFWMTGLLALAALPVLWFMVPHAVISTHHSDTQPAMDQFSAVLKDPQLIRLDVGIFILHFVLTAIFVIVPIALMENIGLDRGDHWKIYISVLSLSIIGIAPIIRYGQHRDLVRKLFLICLTLLIGGLLLIYVGIDSYYGIAFGLWVFFVGFNGLEIMLPSLMSRLAPAGSKGTAIGVYNTFEFSGIFVGGTLGGLIYGAYGLQGVILLSTLMLIVWLIVAVTAPQQKLFDSLQIGFTLQSDDSKQFTNGLVGLPGVAEVTVMVNEEVAYLKVDPALFDNEKLERVANETGVTLKN